MSIGLKVRSVVGACLLAALPSLALAETPPNTSMAMGEIEGIIKLCIKSTPEYAKELQQQMTMLTDSLSPPGARGTAGYQQGYDLVTDALGKIAKPQLIADCKSIVVAPRKEHPEAEHRRE